MTEIYALLAGGMVVGGAGSLIFVLQSSALSPAERAADPPYGKRLWLAVRIIFAGYLVLAACLFLVAIIIGSIAAISIAMGLLMLIAAAWVGLNSKRKRKVGSGVPEDGISEGTDESSESQKG